MDLLIIVFGNKAIKQYQNELTSLKAEKTSHSPHSPHHSFSLLIKKLFMHKKKIIIKIERPAATIAAKLSRLKGIHL